MSAQRSKLAILLWSGGSVTLLVVLYSISVFLTFAISLFGLCVYWWGHRGQARWLRRLTRPKARRGAT